MKRSVGTFVMFALLALATLYFAAGIVLGAASSVRGTTIVRDRPIAWGALPGELLRPGWRQVVERDPILILLVLFVAMVSAAVLSRLSPDVAAKPAVRVIVTVVLVLAFLPAIAGGAGFVCTLLYPHSDGEWLDEDHPAFEAFSLAFSILCWVSWPVFRRQRSQGQLTSPGRSTRPSNSSS